MQRTVDDVVVDSGGARFQEVSAERALQRASMLLTIDVDHAESKLDQVVMEARASQLSRRLRQLLVGNLRVIASAEQAENETYDTKSTAELAHARAIPPVG